MKIEVLGPYDGDFTLHVKGPVGWVDSIISHLGTDYSCIRWAGLSRDDLRTLLEALAEALDRRQSTHCHATHECAVEARCLCACKGCMAANEAARDKLADERETEAVERDHAGRRP